jgi:hypothetical protein
MTVHLYAPCWNEERMLPFFLRHYSDWVDRFFIFDDSSTDASLDILRGHPKVEIRKLEKSHPDSLSLSLRDFFDESWKASRGAADWVVTTKIDEHFYHPSIRSYLDDCQERGVTLVPGLGYQMMTDAFPDAGELLCKAHTKGVPWRQMNKLGIFNPNRVGETRFSPGRHVAAPEGDVVVHAEDELLMLHYKYLGLDYTHSRHQQCLPRQGSRDVERGWGHKWRWDRSELERDWEKFSSKIVDIAEPGLKHAQSHTEPRWWRR